MNVNDTRFGAVFESPEYAIDPTDPSYKATPGTLALQEKRRKKRELEVE